MKMPHEIEPTEREIGDVVQTPMKRSFTSWIVVPTIVSALTVGLFFAYEPFTTWYNNNMSQPDQQEEPEKEADEKIDDWKEKAVAECTKRATDNCKEEGNRIRRDNARTEASCEETKISCDAAEASNQRALKECGYVTSMMDDRYKQTIHLFDNEFDIVKDVKKLNEFMNKKTNELGDLLGQASADIKTEDWTRFLEHYDKAEQIYVTLSTVGNQMKGYSPIMDNIVVKSARLGLSWQVERLLGSYTGEIADLSEYVKYLKATEQGAEEEISKIAEAPEIRQLVNALIEYGSRTSESNSEWNVPIILSEKECKRIQEIAEAGNRASAMIQGDYATINYNATTGVFVFSYTERDHLLGTEDSFAVRDVNGDGITNDWRFNTFSTGNLPTLNRSYRDKLKEVSTVIANRDDQRSASVWKPQGR